jgi:hypothetical protein
MRQVLLAIMAVLNSCASCTHCCAGVLDTHERHTVNRLHKNYFPPSAADAVVEELHIQPLYHLSFEHSASNAARGKCLVALSLRNNGFIAASFPFLCLTNLGLDLLPAPGWVKDEPVMIRKMLRFSPDHFSGSTLEVGAAVHCCTVTLRYKSSFGGCLEFEAGSEHLLANFPNLNLSCAVGAGNYPSQRTWLQVPATALRNAIENAILPVGDASSNQTSNNAIQPELL